MAWLAIIAAAVLSAPACSSLPSLPACVADTDCPTSGQVCAAHVCVLRDGGGARPDSGAPAPVDAAAAADAAPATADGGAVDTGVADSEPIDMGPADTGPTDTGLRDATPIDGGGTCTTTVSCGSDCRACPANPTNGQYACSGSAQPASTACQLTCTQGWGGSGCSVRIGFWTRSSSMTAARIPTLAAFNGFLYAISGLDGAAGAVTPIVERFDPGTSMWTTVSPIPTPRYGAVAAVVNGRIYVIGGADMVNGQLGTVEAFDGTTWTTDYSPMIVARDWPAVGVMGGLIYVAGGSNGSQLASAEVFDPQANGGRGQWSPLPIMPNPHGAGVAGGAGVAALGGAFFYVAGGSGATTGSAQVDRFDPSTNTWAPSGTVHDMLNAREYASGVVLSANGNFYVTGGDNTAGSLRSMERYDPIAGMWIAQADMPAPRNGVQMAELNGKLYYCGGAIAHTTNFYTNLFVFTP